MVFTSIVVQRTRICILFPVCSRHRFSKHSHLRWMLFRIEIEIANFLVRIKKTKYTCEIEKVRCVWLHISHVEISQQKKTRQNGIQRATKYRITFAQSVSVSVAVLLSPPNEYIYLFALSFTLFRLVCPRFTFAAPLSLSLNSTAKKKKYGKINKQSCCLSHAFIHFNFAAAPFFSFSALLFYSTISFRHCLCVRAPVNCSKYFFFQLFVRLTASYTHTHSRLTRSPIFVCKIRDRF